MAKDKENTEKTEKKEKAKKRKGGLHYTIPMMTCGPLLAFGILAMIFCSYRFADVMDEKVEDELTEIADSVLLSYDMLYPGEYELISRGNMIAFFKGEQEVTGNYDIIDRYREMTGAQITLFYRNTRMITTITDESGARLIGTGVNLVIEQTVIDGQQSKFYKKLNINGTDFYVYYKPIINSAGGCVGMIAVGKECSEVYRLVLKSVLPMIIIIAIAFLFAAWISYSYASKLAISIESIRNSLGRISKGDLSGDVDYKLLARNDEISDIGKSVQSMQKSLHALIEKDALTELFNRRLANKKLARMVRDEKELGVEYCVALCDIDFFKKVNDTYGHEMGDVVLKEVAKVLRTHMVGKGFAARWGGEEFLLVFNNMGVKAAHLVAQKILDEIRGLQIDRNQGSSEEELFGEFIAGKTGEIEIIEDDGCETEQYLTVDDAYIPFIKVTMTIGIANGGMGRSQDEVVRLADEKLYFGKENGRNRIVVEEIEEEDEDDEDFDYDDEEDTKKKNKKKNKSKKK